MAQKQKAVRCVFLDRDGVINLGGNIDRADDVRLVPGVADAIRKLKQAGFLVIVASNQGGLGERVDGSIAWKNHPLTREALAAIHAEILKQLGEGAAPDAIKFCPHSVSVGCECRKPNAGMLLAAAEEFGIDLAFSFMVGDRASDVHAGIAAGVVSVLVLSGPEGPQTKEREKVQPGTPCFASLVEAADWIIASPR